MRPHRILYSPTVLSANSICLVQTKAEAGALLINGALAVAGVATIPIPRHLSIYSAADEHLITFTVTGKDRYGRALTETHIGPTAGATVKLAYNFATVTGVSVSGALSGNVTVGTADEMETPWVPLNIHDRSASLGVVISSGGSMVVAIQSTRDDIWNTPESEITATTEVTIRAPTELSADSEDMGVPVAVRLKITEYVSGTVRFNVVTYRS